MSSAEEESPATPPRPLRTSVTAPTPPPSGMALRPRSGSTSSRRSTGSRTRGHEPDVRAGDRVPSLDGGRIVTARYVGNTHFKVGKWVGIELDEGQVGKHNGTCQGRKYFDCADNRGVFLPLAGVEVITSGDEAAEVLQKQLVQAYKEMADLKSTYEATLATMRHNAGSAAQPANAPHRSEVILPHGAPLVPLLDGLRFELSEFRAELSVAMGMVKASADALASRPAADPGPGIAQAAATPPAGPLPSAEATKALELALGDVQATLGTLLLQQERLLEEAQQARQQGVASSNNSTHASKADNEESAVLSLAASWEKRVTEAQSRLAQLEADHASARKECDLLRTQLAETQAAHAAWREEQHSSFTLLQQELENAHTRERAAQEEAEYSRTERLRLQTLLDASSPPPALSGAPPAAAPAPVGSDASNLALLDALAADKERLEKQVEFIQLQHAAQLAALAQERERTLETLQAGLREQQALAMEPWQGQVVVLQRENAGLVAQLQALQEGRAALVAEAASLRSQLEESRRQLQQVCDERAAAKAEPAVSSAAVPSLEKDPSLLAMEQNELQAMLAAHYEQIQALRSLQHGVGKADDEVAQALSRQVDELLASQLQHLVQRLTRCEDAMDVLHSRHVAPLLEDAPRTPQEDSAFF